VNLFSSLCVVDSFPVAGSGGSQGANRGSVVCWLQSLVNRVTSVQPGRISLGLAVGEAIALLTTHKRQSAREGDSRFNWVPATRTVFHTHYFGGTKSSSDRAPNLDRRSG
jgi:hypothetical protein